MREGEKIRIRFFAADDILAKTKRAEKVWLIENELENYRWMLRRKREKPPQDYRVEMI